MRRRKRVSLFDEVCRLSDLKRDNPDAYRAQCETTARVAAAVRKGGILHDGNLVDVQQSDETEYRA